MVDVAVTNAHGSIRIPHATVRRSVSTVFRGERRGTGRVSVVFIGTRFTRKLNRRFLAHDSTTDVISFPLTDGGDMEGEIYVNLDQARRQAADYGVSFTNETIRLVVHGTLHLLGYDDLAAADARIMRQREDRYVKRICRA
jgi:probable rRNA maturation factor